MTVYVDDFNIKAEVPNGKRTVKGVWCHMTADTREELDTMADEIGLRRAWIQHPGTWQEHYDVTQPKRNLAVQRGAVEVSFRERTREMYAAEKIRREAAKETS